MATYDYRVTVSDSSNRGVYELHAGRVALAVHQALDLHRHAFKAAGPLNPTRTYVEAERLGVHKRPTCGGTCTLAAVPGRAECGAPCAGLENHVSYHRCADHPRNLGVNPAYLAITTEGVGFARFAR